MYHGKPLAVYSTREFKEENRNGDRTCLLPTQEEFETGYIKGAACIPNETIDLEKEEAFPALSYRGACG